MRSVRRLSEALAIGAVAALCAIGAPDRAAMAQAPAAPAINAGPVQPWGLPPLPAGVGAVEKFADLGGTPQGKFLEGGAFDTDGNLWFVAIGSGWVSYLTPDGKVTPALNCNPPEEYRPDLRAAGHPLARRQAVPDDAAPRHSDL